MTPAALAAIAISAVTLVLMRDISLLFVVLLLLIGSIYFDRWGKKPTLKLGKDSLEYRHGKLIATIKRSDIVGAGIKGNRFVGRTLVITGEAFVSVDGGKPIKRSSVDVPDVFGHRLEEIRTMILSG
ncbi:MAG: hypothetical protein HY848_12570 [Betaproteobacteria bacterium]|nr:hypothetical protein [Betaproteobacteria bacterium]